MLNRFARMNELIEDLSPTQSIRELVKNWNSFSDPVTLVKILSMEYPANNLGNKKAIKWIARSLGVFDDEIDVVAGIHMDLGDGVYYFSEPSEHSTITLKQFYQLLCIDCSKIGSEQFDLFNEMFSKMSPMERKWFVRYWVRTPRNGLSEGNIRKLLAKVYDKKLSEVKKHCQYNTLTEVTECYENDIIPDCSLTIASFLPPMLAKSVPRREWPKDYILEYKYDGARYQIHKRDGLVIIFNRSGKVVNKQFRDIADKVEDWPQDNFIIDTEIYPVDGDRPAPFQKLGTRIHSKDLEKAMIDCPVELAVFDCMVYDKNTIVDLPLRDRIAMMDFPCQAVRKTDDIKGFYAEAISLGYEGVMIKNANARYHSGKRSKSWAKHKPPRIELDVVITGARYGDGKNSNLFASFDISVMDDGDLVNVGSLGNGFSDSDLMRLTSTLRPLTMRFMKGTYEVLPRVVLTVSADLVSKNKDNGYGLRFPRMKAIRDDKPVSEIDTLEQLVGMV